MLLNFICYYVNTLYVFTAEICSYSLLWCLCLALESRTHYNPSMSWIFYICTFNNIDLFLRVWSLGCPNFRFQRIDSWSEAFSYLTEGQLLTLSSSGRESSGPSPPHKITNSTMGTRMRWIFKNSPLFKKKTLEKHLILVLMLIFDVIHQWSHLSLGFLCRNILN